MKLMLINSEFSEQLQQIAKRLDISPTDYKKAVQRYESIGEYLESDEIADDINIYPQGSFALGTVIRPLNRSKEREYDIDLVCEYPFDRNNISPRALKEICKDRLESHQTYSKMLEKEKRRCWCIKYAESEEIGFHVDILPVVPRKNKPDQIRLKRETNQTFSAHVDFNLHNDNSVLLTDKNFETKIYAWGNTNPLDYAEWFRSCHRNVFVLSEIEQKRSIFGQNKDLYASIDEVPSQLVRTPLQRVVQLFKRHRDVRFDGNSSEEFKPISIIITTIAAKLYSGEMDIGSALVNIISQMNFYSPLLSSQSPSDWHRLSQTKSNIIQRKTNGEWVFNNPVDPEENFADRWHENNHARARAFFKWVRWLQEDFLEANDFDSLTGIFGDKYSKNIIATVGAGFSTQAFPEIHIDKNSVNKPYSR